MPGANGQSNDEIIADLLNATAKNAATAAALNATLVETQATQASIKAEFLAYKQFTQAEFLTYQQFTANLTKVLETVTEQAKVLTDRNEHLEAKDTVLMNLSIAALVFTGSVGLMYGVYKCYNKSQNANGQNPPVIETPRGTHEPTIIGDDNV